MGVLGGRTGGSVGYGDETDYGLLCWRFLSAHNVATSVTYWGGEFSNLRQISSSIKIADGDIKKAQYHVPLRL